jgi:hypothetical protein
VAIGSSAKQTVTLTNSGPTDYTVTKAVASGGDFVVTGPSLPLTLAEGQSATFTRRFAPVAIGNASGTLLITKSQVTTTLQSRLMGPVCVTHSNGMRTIAFVACQSWRRFRTSS